MKNIFIVTSALRTDESVITPKERFSQTIETLKILRKKIPDAQIIFAEGSPYGIEQEQVQSIGQYVNIVADFSSDPDVSNYSRSGKKSLSECMMLYRLLKLCETEKSLHSLFEGKSRIFKLSARTYLHNNFSISDYDGLENKYVFKKAIASWLPKEKQLQTTDHLFITRFYSWCNSLTHDYKKILLNALSNICIHNIDTEHCHHLLIDKSKVVQFETLHCTGIISTTGTMETY